MDIIVRPHLSQYVGQLGDVARNPMRLINRQPVGDFVIARISVAVDVGEALSFESTTLKPPSSALTVHGGGNRPHRRETSGSLES